MRHSTELFEKPALRGFFDAQRKATAITPKWINDIAAKMDKIMEKIASVHSHYYLALKYCYQFKSLELVADQSACSKATAKSKKKAAFDMVVMALMD